MREKANGVLVAYYTAYIDHGGNFWLLYPKKRLVYRQDVAFAKKKISVINGDMITDISMAK